MLGPRVLNLGTAAGALAPLLGLASFLVLEGDTPAELLPFLVIFVAPFEMGFVFGRMAPWRGARLGGAILAVGVTLGLLVPMAGPGYFLAAGLAVAFAMPDLKPGDAGPAP
jgi:hypothetical protein